MTVSEIRVATVSCSDLETSLRFWRDTVGFDEIWRADVAGPALERAWGLPAGTEARVALLRYDGVPTGQLRLVQLSQHSGIPVRGLSDPVPSLGPAALDCAVRDPEGAYAHLAHGGWESPSDAPHYYEVGGLEQAEVVFHAPDEVKFLCVGAASYPPDMTRQGVAGLFSPLTTVSQFVADIDESARFYRDGLGLTQSLDAWVDDASRNTVDELVGLPPATPLRLAVFKAPGEPDGKHLLLQTAGVPTPSLAERMRFPNLGIVLLGHETDDLDGLRERIPAFGGTIESETVEVDFAGRARVRSFLARAPQGILLELAESR